MKCAILETFWRKLNSLKSQFILSISYMFSVFFLFAHQKQFETFQCFNLIGIE